MRAFLLSQHGDSEKTHRFIDYKFAEYEDRDREEAFEAFVAAHHRDAEREKKAKVSRAKEMRARRR